jgi:hypothetical protein
MEGYDTKIEGEMEEAMWNGNKRRGVGCRMKEEAEGGPYIRNPSVKGHI